MGKYILEANHLTKSYRFDRANYLALQDVSLTVAEGEFVAIVGPSGSGKTTLLNLLGTLDRPTSGTLAIWGEQVERQSVETLARFRASHLGFIFQAFNLIPVLTAFENVELPLLDRGMKRRERQQRVADALGTVGLAHVSRHRVPQLSGGEQQRVAIARAIVHQPKLILADEPTGNLDSQNGTMVRDLLHLLHHQLGCTILMVTHDLALAQVAPRLVRLRDGNVVHEAGSDGVLQGGAS